MRAWLSWWEELRGGTEDSGAVLLLDGPDLGSPPAAVAQVSQPDFLTQAHFVEMSFGLSHCGIFHG